ncbi:MAG TPA: hypothetical protein VFJ52_08435, partial [Terriglobia bacterium]|nr:hypothetical protein [Terriglobia bacterium]
MVNTTLNPLKVLSTVVEGLSVDPGTGLWLKPFSSITISMVPKLFPFDLVYLDEQKQIVDVIGVLPGKRVEGLREEADSALVLPFHSTYEMRLAAGMRLNFLPADAAETEARRTSPAETIQPAPERKRVEDEVFPASLSRIFSGLNAPLEPMAPPPPPMTPRSEMAENLKGILTDPFVERRNRQQAGQPQPPAPVSQPPQDAPSAESDTSLIKSRTRGRARVRKEPSRTVPLSDEYRFWRSGQPAAETSGAEKPDEQDLTTQPAEVPPLEAAATPGAAEKRSSLQSLLRMIEEALPAGEIARPGEEQRAAAELKPVAAAPPPELMTRPPVEAQEAATRADGLTPQNVMQPATEAAETPAALQSLLKKIEETLPPEPVQPPMERPKVPAAWRPRKPQATPEPAPGEIPTDTPKQEPLPVAAQEAPAPMGGHETQAQLPLLMEAMEAPSSLQNLVKAIEGAQPAAEVVLPMEHPAPLETLQSEETHTTAEPALPAVSPELPLTEVSPVAAEEAAAPVGQLEQMVETPPVIAAEFPAEIAKEAAAPEPALRAIEVEQPPAVEPRVGKKSWPEVPPPAPFPEKSRRAVKLFNTLRKTEPVLHDVERGAMRMLRSLIPRPGTFVNRRMALRKPMPGLVAYKWGDRSAGSYEVENLSASGLYLATRERWPLGTVVSLELERAGDTDKRPKQRAAIEAGTVRWGPQGLGLLFVMPNDYDIRLWEGLPESPFFPIGPDTVVRELRTAYALAFLRQTCPSVEEECKVLLHKEFSFQRAVNAVDIVLMAEDMIARDPDTFRFRANAKLVMKVLEVGSWVDSEPVQRLWAGLLATSCTASGDEEINMMFAERLTQFSPLHADILAAACAPAVAALSARGEAAPSESYCTAKEFVEATGTRNLNKIHQGVLQLCDLGLLEMREDASSAGETAEMRTSA